MQSQNILVVLDNGFASTMTDSDGNWSLPSVPIGTHVITVSKDGFGMTQFYNVQVVPNGLTWVPLPSRSPSFLMPSPTGGVTIDSVRIDSTVGSGNDILWTYFTFDSISTFADFIDTAANVQPSEPHLFAWNYLMEGNGKGISRHLFSEISGLGVKHGAALYYSVCKMGFGGMGNGIYYDPTHDQYRIVSPGPKSNVVKLTMR